MIVRWVLAGLVALSGSSAVPSSSEVFHRPIVRVSANKSNNWSGYNQGTLEKAGKLFHQVASTWVVPTATRHKAGEAEFSATWVGIGGGCVDAGCTVTDSTLIQAGTSQDVSSTHATAEWIEETPVVIQNSGTVQVGPMPNLSVVQFSASSTNNGPAGLVPSERMQLVDANGAPLATPSAPRNDAFHDCTYSATCT